jgi:hypothetical protein
VLQRDQLDRWIEPLQPALDLPLKFVQVLFRTPDLVSSAPSAPKKRRARAHLEKGSGTKEVV